MYHWGLINWEFIDFVTSLKDISASKIHGSSWDICVHVETSYFFFSKYLRNYREFLKSQEIFSSSTKYYFVQKVRYLRWNLPDLELGSMYYSLKKRAGFSVMINLKFEKMLMSLLASFALSKSKNLKEVRRIT